MTCIAVARLASSRAEPLAHGVVSTFGRGEQDVDFADLFLERVHGHSLQSPGDDMGIGEVRPIRRGCRGTHVDGTYHLYASCSCAGAAATGPTEGAASTYHKF